MRENKPCCCRTRLYVAKQAVLSAVRGHHRLPDPKAGSIWSRGRDTGVWQISFIFHCGIGSPTSLRLMKRILKYDIQHRQQGAPRRRMKDSLAVAASGTGFG